MGAGLHRHHAKATRTYAFRMIKFLSSPPPSSIQIFFTFATRILPSPLLLPPQFKSFSHLPHGLCPIRVAYLKTRMPGISAVVMRSVSACSWLLPPVWTHLLSAQYSSLSMHARGRNTGTATATHLPHRDLRLPCVLLTQTLRVGLPQRECR